MSSEEAEEPWIPTLWDLEALKVIDGDTHPDYPKPPRPQPPVETYTKAQIDAKLAEKVDVERTVNNNPLTSDITLDASDVGALAVDGKAKDAEKADTATTAVSAGKDGAGNVITDHYAAKTEVAGKQNRLIAGENISIVGDVISAAGGSAPSTNVVSLTEASVELADNTIYRAVSLPSMAFTLPTGLSIDGLLDAEIDVTVDAAPMQVTAPAGIDWMGDDITDGAWVPVQGKRYVLYIYWDGVRYRAISQSQKVV